MARDPRFSKRGELPTEYEVKLLSSAAGDSAWISVARSLARTLGADLGARALMAVLDEIPSEKVHTPTREQFMRKLARPELLAQMLHLSQVEKMSDKKIAVIMGISRQAVRQAVNAAGRALHDRQGKQRA